MIRGANDLAKFLLYPVSSATNATSTGTVDCVTYSQGRIEIDYGVASSDVTTLKLGECATSGGTYTDIATFTGGDTTDGFTIPSADTSNGVMVRWNINLRKRKRYLKLTFQNTSAATVVSSKAYLSRAHQVQTTDANLGYDVVHEG